MSSLTGLGAAQAAMPQIQAAYDQALAAVGGNPDLVPDAFKQGLASGQQNLAAWQNSPDATPRNRTQPFTPPSGAFGSQDIPGAFNTTADAYNKIDNAYQQALVAVGGDPSKVPDAFKTGMDTANKNMGAWADAYRTSDPSGYMGDATRALGTHAASSEMPTLQWIKDGIANGTLVNNNGRITAPDGSSPANPFQGYNDSAFAPLRQMAGNFSNFAATQQPGAWAPGMESHGFDPWGGGGKPTTDYGGYGSDRGYAFDPRNPTIADGPGDPFPREGGTNPSQPPPNSSYYGPYITPGATGSTSGGGSSQSGYQTNGSFYPSGGQGAFSQFQQPYQAPQNNQPFFQ